MDVIGTCSIENPKDDCATFARNDRWLAKLFGCRLRLIVYTAKLKTIIGLWDSIILMETDYPEYAFTLFHNDINADKKPQENIIGERCNIHPTSVVCEGTHVGVGPNEVKVQMKHMGNVRFGNDVNVGALTLIERAIFDSTIIGNGAKIDCGCLIGHNAIIEENLVTGTGVIIGGSTIIGKNCWFGNGANIKPGLKICDHVILGTGAVVVKDIYQPGIYAGVPAVFKKPYKEGWTF